MSTLTCVTISWMLLLLRILAQGSPISTVVGVAALLGGPCWTAVDCINACDEGLWIPNPWPRASGWLDNDCWILDGGICCPKWSWDRLEVEGCDCWAEDVVVTVCWWEERIWDLWCKDCGPVWGLNDGVGKGGFPGAPEDNHGWFWDLGLWEVVVCDWGEGNPTDWTLNMPWPGKFCKGKWRRNN